MKSTIKALVVLLILFVFGFFSEFVKVNINYHIATGESIPGYFDQNAQTRKLWLDQSMVNAPFDYYYSHSPLHVLHYFSLGQLKMLKWAVTLLFTLIFFLLNARILRYVISDVHPVQWLRIGYGALFLLSFVIFATGKLTGHQEAFYAVSHKIVSALQSAVPLMIVYPAWLLYSANQKHS